VPHTIAYLDARVTTPEEIVHLLGEKVGTRAEPAFSKAAQALHDVATAAAKHGVTTGFHQTLCAGMTLSGRYGLERRIAIGGMGQVWEAVDNRLDRRVAVKVLQAVFSLDPEFVERFRAEARAVALLNHPGIATVYAYGETDIDRDGRTAYVVMELVNGEPLNSVLERSGRLSLRDSLDMLEQAGWALQAAHTAGVVHRDVKPGNILITPTGQVKLTDFGIAKALDAAPVTETGKVFSSAGYIAPEQALGHEATAASDVYSLGVVAYEALSGVLPFTGDGVLSIAMKHIKEAPPPLPADLPPNVNELIEITLAKKPDMRYRSGGQFADAVAAVRAGHRPPRPPPPAPDTPTIFVSYMSEDADAARRLCEAITSLGGDVRLYGPRISPGDAGEQEVLTRIRRTIRLFVPIISANTERAEEGYFFVEWSEAADRSRRIFGRRFIVPVIIDNDYAGDPSRYRQIPDAFKDCHFGHAPAGEPDAKLLAMLTAEIRAMRRTEPA
jgi:serine/threonine protein kinase